MKPMRIPDFSSAKVLVIGDVMLDQYWHGGTSRISPEAPVPVVKVEQSEYRPGGAANVALNIAALGAQVGLIGLVGEDASAQALQAQMEGAGVQCHLMAIKGSSTITKLRVMSRHQQMIRLDFEDGFAGFEPHSLAEKVASVLPDYDLMILSDYAKGCLRDAQPLIALANENNIPVLVDPKGADFTKYTGATLLTPNESELKAVVGEWEDEAEFCAKSHGLCKQINLDAVLVTRSEKGMALFNAFDELHIPTQAREVFDVTGAGDTVIGTLGAALASGMSLEDSVKLSNAAAGIVVGKVGTATTNLTEIREAFKPVHSDNIGVVSDEQLLDLVFQAKEKGERVVITNGCFDILHAGHVQYLQEAAKLGDRLIVAVNSDASVKKLKGSSRPINTLGERMAVLASLKAVDWVVSFEGSLSDASDDSTPRDLICAVKPDILVKGGDYQPESVAGGECAGEVVILSFKEGCSTTQTLKKMGSL
jgi:D-beta-D-heptose 7-phosphate kinase/D-beta-D-heptose 1-phosphate adenosyltransferase